MLVFGGVKILGFAAKMKHFAKVILVFKFFLVWDFGVQRHRQTSLSCCDFKKRFEPTLMCKDEEKMGSNRVKLDLFVAMVESPKNYLQLTKIHPRNI